MIYATQKRISALLSACAEERAFPPTHFTVGVKPFFSTKLGDYTVWECVWMSTPSWLVCGFLTQVDHI